MKTLVILLFCICAAGVNAQDLLDTITVETCGCIEKIDSDLRESERNTRMGLCILEASAPFKDELLVEYNVNLNDLNGKTGKQFGELVGIRMASTCPTTLISMTQQVKNNNSKTDDQSVDGTIKALHNGQFYSLEVETEKRMHTFLWMDPFDNSHELLQNSKGLEGKKVKITYREQELFDPKINDYRSFNVISGLVWL